MLYRGITAMKVLHLGKNVPPSTGGIELFTYDLLECLNANGVQADLLCFGEKNINGVYNGFNFYSCEMNLKIRSAPISIDFIKKFKKIESTYDIIHIHSPNPLAEILSIFSSKPKIIHWHSDIVKQKILLHFYKPIQQIALKKSKKIIFTSPQYLNSSKQALKYKYKSIVIPLGINKKRLDFCDKDSLFAKIYNKINNKKIILSIGRLVYYKGFEYLIKAAKFLPKDAVIIIIGNGYLYNSLKELINKLNLNNVYLLGRVDNIGIFLKNCDIFCLPSIERSEAFGLVLAEALYYDKPLITTNVDGSGMNYINKQGETGLVVSPKNPESLARAINELLDDKHLYQKFVMNIKKWKSEFDISKISNQIISVYSDIIKK